MISRNLPVVQFNKALEHCKKLAKKYAHELIVQSIHGCQVVLMSDMKLSGEKPVGEFINIGGVGCHSLSWDRFLNIEFNSDSITFENDYAGTIPVFYSNRVGFVASNIEPCVFLATDASLMDINPENVYGFLRYSHFVWDETAWSHIHQILPDARYKFSADGRMVNEEYLATVCATDIRAKLSDKQVANDLFELNKKLVRRSLEDSEEIILPLSAGYDSRMIFSVLANDKQLACKTRCFTYGTEGSIEVEAGRRLTRQKNIQWDHVQLPCEFLDRASLLEISDVFGASMHMHGMYQNEFYRLLNSRYGISKYSRLASGFMTGVPAGQHNGKLQITTDTSSLTEAMNCFSQSRDWTDKELAAWPIFSGKNYLEKAEIRFRHAFDRFDGEIYQKAVMFDVWTRQRNFISYYPRTLEWHTTVVSPHMCAEYGNFFMSLSKKHLWNRRAVELMFLYHYPDVAKVASNSNGIASIGSQVETGLFFISRLFNLLGLPNILPKRYRNTPIEFDLKAVTNCKNDAFFPLMEDIDELSAFIKQFGGHELIHELYEGALNGDAKSYARIVVLQAIALNGILK